MIQRQNEDGTLELIPESDAERELSSVEWEIGTRCLEGVPQDAIVRKQFESAIVESRTITDVGSFTGLTISHPEADPWIQASVRKSVTYSCDSAEAPAIAVFLADRGFLTTIETFSAINERRPADSIIASILGNDASVEIWD